MLIAGRPVGNQKWGQKQTVRAAPFPATRSSWKTGKGSWTGGNKIVPGLPPSPQGSIHDSSVAFLSQ